MILKPYRDNFITLSRAFDDGNVCLLECRERATGNPAFIICAVGCESENYHLVPFARLFDGNPYELLDLPGVMEQPLTEGGRP